MHWHLQGDVKTLDNGNGTVIHMFATLNDPGTNTHSDLDAFLTSNVTSNEYITGNG